MAFSPIGEDANLVFFVTYVVDDSLAFVFSLGRGI